MQDTEILVPKENIIKVGGREYRIGKLSLKQGILLSRFIARTILSSQEKLQAFAKKTENSKSNVEDIMTLTELLNPEDLFEFYGILLNENDRGFLLENLDLEVGSEIIALVFENNDIEKIKKNIQRIMAIISLLNQKNKKAI